MILAIASVIFLVTKFSPRLGDSWLNNIRKFFRNDRDKIIPIMDEIKRRKKLRYERSKSLTKHHNSYEKRKGSN